MTRVLGTGWRYANPTHHGPTIRSALEAAVIGQAGQHTLVPRDPNGFDRLAASIAADMGWATEAHPADWDAECRPTCKPDHRSRRRDGSTYCPAAGNYRNQLLVDLGADIGVGFPGPATGGTADCMRRAKRAGIRMLPYPIDVPYRALSIQQPWVEAILQLWKPIENRTWATDYRGLVLLQASAKLDYDGGLFVRERGHQLDEELLPLGAIVGAAELAGICDRGVRGRPCDCGEWAANGQYHWRLRNRRRLPAEPAKGSLGLWVPDAELVARVDPHVWAVA